MSSARSGPALVRPGRTVRHLDPEGAAPRIHEVRLDERLAGVGIRREQDVHALRRPAVLHLVERDDVLQRTQVHLRQADLRLVHAGVRARSVAEAPGDDPTVLDRRAAGEPNDLAAVPLLDEEVDIRELEALGARDLALLLEEAAEAGLCPVQGLRGRPAGRVERLVDPLHRLCRHSLRATLLGQQVPRALGALGRRVLRHRLHHPERVGRRRQRHPEAREVVGLQRVERQAREARRRRRGRRPLLDTVAATGEQGDDQEEDRENGRGACHGGLLSRRPVRYLPRPDGYPWRTSPRNRGRSRSPDYTRPRS